MIESGDVIFTELRRRNVFKVGLAYAIVAWLLIQIAATVAPALHLPDWTLPLVTYLTVIGFLLALFLAWAYELTPEGIKTASPEGPAQYHTRTTGQRLNKSTSPFYPNDFTPDMSQLVFTNLISANKFEIHVLSMTGERTEQPLITSDFVETQPDLSPDGHWLAYISTETGHDEVYVRPFPDVNNGKWRISTGGGMEPHWRRDGKELFYALGQYTKGKIEGVAAVGVDTASGFQAGKPETLFTGDYTLGLNRSYDVTPDAQRFVMLKRIAEAGDDIEAQLTSLVTVDNWFVELKRLAPPAQ